MIGRAPICVAMLTGTIDSGCAAPKPIVSETVESHCLRPAHRHPRDPRLPPLPTGVELYDASFDEPLFPQRRARAIWSRGGEHILTVEDGRAIVWRAKTGRAARIHEIPNARPVRKFAATRDLSRLALLEEGPGARVRIIDLDGSVDEAVHTDASARGMFAFSEDETALIAHGELWTVDPLRRIRQAVLKQPRREPHPLRQPSAPRHTDDPTTDPREGRAAFVHVGADDVFPVRGPGVHRLPLRHGARWLTFTESSRAVQSHEDHIRAYVLPGSVRIESPLDPRYAMELEVPQDRSYLVVSDNGRYVGVLAWTFTIYDTVTGLVVARVRDCRWANRGAISNDGSTAILRRVDDRPQMSQVSTHGPENPSTEAPGPPRIAAIDIPSVTVLWSVTGAEARELAGRLTRDGRYLWRSNRVMETRTRRIRRFRARVVGIAPEVDRALLEDDCGRKYVVPIR